MPTSGHFSQLWANIKSKQKWRVDLFHGRGCIMWVLSNYHRCSLTRDIQFRLFTFFDFWRFGVILAHNKYRQTLYH